RAPDFRDLAIGIGRYRLHRGFRIMLDLRDLAFGLVDPAAHAVFVAPDLPVIEALARGVAARTFQRDQQVLIRQLAFRFRKGVERGVGTVWCDTGDAFNRFDLFDGVVDLVLDPADMGCGAVGHGIELFPGFVPNAPDFDIGVLDIDP